jgi:FkbM family methyltransferase
MGNPSFFHRISHALFERLLPDVIVPVPIVLGPLRGLLIEINLRWERQFIYGNYEFEMMKAIQDFVKPGNVVYDVGAHVGYFTLLISILAGPKGYCFAFEPSPPVSQRLETNIHKNKWKLDANVQIMKMALFDEVGEREFFLGGSTSTGRLTRFAENVPREKLVVVPLSTIDNLTKAGIPAPQVIKIDVESAEDHVIRGAIHTLKKTAPVLLCEIHSVEAGLNVFGILKGINYSIRDLKTGHIWNREDKVAKGHIVAVRAEANQKVWTNN